ncbi:GAF domain-containing protein [Paeniroseomonas aquatica]|uniref:GAF domain-containing protein n=1 Tax=Paeniroseomonas aquatica TaxID=373043 RepID=UPI00361E6434
MQPDRGALGTDLAKVMELREDGETLFVRAGVGWKPGVVGEATVKASDHTSEGHALKTGRPMISPDIAEERRFSYPPFLTENGVKAVANVPIIGKEESLPSASCRSTAASRAASPMPTPPSSAPMPTSSRPRWTACARPRTSATARRGCAGARSGSAASARSRRSG